MESTTLGKRMCEDKEEEAKQDSPPEDAQLKQRRLNLSPSQSLYAFRSSEAFHHSALWRGMENIDYEAEDDEPTELFSRAVAFHEKLFQSHFKTVVHATMFAEPGDEELLRYVGDDRLLYLLDLGHKEMFTPPKEMVRRKALTKHERAADAAAVSACLEGRLDVLLLLEARGHGFERVYKKDLLAEVCRHGHLKVAHWLFQFPDAAAGLEGGLALAIKHGHLDVAQWIWSLLHEEAKPDMEKIFQGEAFEDVCARGHLDVAQWMWQTMTVTIEDEPTVDRAFVLTCLNGHVPMAQWLVDTCNASIFTENGLECTIVEHRIVSKTICVGKVLAEDHVDMAKWLIRYCQLDEEEVLTPDLFETVCSYTRLKSAQYIKERCPASARIPKYPFCKSSREGKLAFLRWVFQTYSREDIQKSKTFQDCMEMDMEEEMMNCDIDAVWQTQDLFKEYGVDMDLSVPIVRVIASGDCTPAQLAIGHASRLTRPLDWKQVFLACNMHEGARVHMLECFPDIRQALLHDRVYLELCNTNTNWNKGQILSTCKRLEKEEADRENKAAAFEALGDGPQVVAE